MGSDFNFHNLRKELKNHLILECNLGEVELPWPFDLHVILDEATWFFLKRFRQQQTFTDEQKKLNKEFLNAIIEHLQKLWDSPRNQDPQETANRLVSAEKEMLQRAINSHVKQIIDGDSWTLQWMRHEIAREERARQTAVTKNKCPNCITPNNVCVCGEQE